MRDDGDGVRYQVEDSRKLLYYTILYYTVCEERGVMLELEHNNLYTGIWSCLYSV